MIVLTADQAAQVDSHTIEEIGLPGLVLMETAGRALVHVIEDRFTQEMRRGVVLVAGPGNNGGDGFVAARALHLRGMSVQLFLLGAADRLKGDAARMYQVLCKTAGGTPDCEVQIRELHGVDDVNALRSALQTAGVAVDALFGTGLSRAVEGIAAEIIGALNDSYIPVVAMDIPSGVNGTTGAVHGTAVEADLTVCAGFLKRGLLLYPGAECCGEIYVAEIGFSTDVARHKSDGVELTSPAQVGSWLPRRGATAHKGTTGRLTVVAGSDGMTGAAMLAAGGALRCGAGLVTLCIPKTLRGRMHEAPLEALVRAVDDDGRGYFNGSSSEALEEAVAGVHAVAVGPGTGRHRDTLEVLRNMLDRLEVPTVVDADALRAFPLCRKRGRDRVLTPHVGEMATLLERSVGDILADPVGAARDCANRFGVIALLKGAHTVTAAPDGRVRINFTGNPGMASGGMGDTLTGIIGALLAQGVNPFDAASAGAFVHGRAADRVAAAGGRGFLAHDVADALPETIEEIVSRPSTVPFPRSV